MNQIQLSMSLQDDPDDGPVSHVFHDPDTGLPLPKPTTPEPAFVTIAQFLFEAVTQTTDDFLVETDGIR